MLQTKVFIFAPASLGAGKYTIELYWNSPGVAKFARLGDVITDTASNKYELISPTSLPLSDGAVVTVQFLTNDVLPVEDSNYDSTIETPGQIDPTPEVSTGGNLLTQALLSGPEYKYTITASWDDPTDANLSDIGDMVVDASGKHFEVVLFNNPSLKWGDSVVVTELDTEGVSPVIGKASLFRPTVNNDFYQGTELTNQARTVAKNRDTYFIDAKLKELETQIGAGSGELVSSSYTNNTGSTINSLFSVSTNASGEIKICDVSSEVDVKALKGVSSEAIPDSSTGQVAKLGLIKDITTSFSHQDSVFIAKDGSLTNVPPEIGSNGFISGDFVVYIGHISKNESNPTQKDLELRPQIIGQL